MHLTFVAISLFCFVGFSSSLSSFGNDTIVTQCGWTATRNNTNWQVNASSNCCALTIQTNATPEICQIRLDFISFTTAQPVAGTCVDTFQVTGSTSSVPVICGDNAGQHMYLDVSSSSDVQLLFNLKSDISITRSWNIKIAMLPCGAPYLAPLDCLQYFTGAMGRVKSFNWMDVFSPITSQLNNQKYNICFRTELVSGSRTSHICLSPCQVVNGDAFSITTPPAVFLGTGSINNGFDAMLAAASSAAGTVIGDPSSSPGATVAACLYDFLLIAGGRDFTTGVEADRFCGNQLNPSPGSLAGSGAFIPGKPISVVVCTPITPFRITYRTDGTEAAVTSSGWALPVQATADVANTGFCLDYQEK